jgi:phage FluMu gp28-like protein
MEQFSFSSGSVGKLAVTLHMQLKNRLFALPADPELRDELLNVRLRETGPGVYRIDHDADKHDDRAIALALAAVELLQTPSSAPDPAFWRHFDDLYYSRARGPAYQSPW